MRLNRAEYLLMNNPLGAVIQARPPMRSIDGPR
jgi:hypothetical protein